MEKTMDKDEIPQFYSSNEDVAWGPVTLREIKRDLTREKNNLKPNFRRQTISSIGTMSCENTISSCSSKYITANEESFVEDSDADLKDSIHSNHTQSSITEPEPVPDDSFNDSIRSNSDQSEHVIVLTSSEDESVKLEDSANEEILDTLNEISLGSYSSGNVSLDKTRPNVEIIDEIIIKTPCSKGLGVEELEDFLEASCELSDKENSFNDTLDDMEEFLKENQPKASMETVQEPISKIPKPQFKVPYKYPAKKTLTLSDDEKYKHIVSPVRLYIKNSSMPVLKRNHTPKTTSSGRILQNMNVLNVTKPKHRNIVDNFPEVFYEPSELVLEKNENSTIIPNNIKKLITQSTVIKHEIRTKLNEMSKIGDFSMCEDIYDSANVSIHVAKQHFNV